MFRRSSVSLLNRMSALSKHKHVATTTAKPSTNPFLHHRVIAFSTIPKRQSDNNVIYKEEIIHQFAKSHGLPYAEGKRMLNTFLGLCELSLLEGKNVTYRLESLVAFIARLVKSLSKITAGSRRSQQAALLAATARTEKSKKDDSFIHSMRLYGSRPNLLSHLAFDDKVTQPKWKKAWNDY